MLSEIMIIYTLLLIKDISCINMIYVSISPESYGLLFAFV